VQRRYCGELRGLSDKISTSVNGEPDSIKSEPMRYRNIASIMTHEVFTIKPESTLHEAAQIMGEKHIGSLIVVKYGTPVGIMTEGDLLNVVSDGIPLERDWIHSSPSIYTETVEKFMSSPVIKICYDYRLTDAARLMIEKRVRRLGVCDSGHLVGIVTTSDMIGCLPQVPETMKIWFEVDHFMSKKVVTADEEMLLEDVAKIMAEKNVGSVIVTSQDEPFGIFTERDLLTRILCKDKTLVEHVGNVCSSSLITAPIGISVHEAAEIMTEKHIKRLPITENGKLVGVLSARDLVEAYARD
jgi:CBS domain-containing protein